MEFVAYLNSVFTQRSEANPSYSLRAFARDLKVDQSSLSKIMAGKRVPSAKYIAKVAPLVGLPLQETKKLLVTKKPIRTGLFKKILAEEFNAISDWYHDAILELIDTANFQPNIDWISKRLGVSSGKISAAVESLIRINWLKIDANGNWIDTSKNTSIHPETNTTEALKRYQKQILKKSLKSLEKDSLSTRSHTSITFSASPEKIEEAKALISKCRKEVAALLRSSEQDKTEVFHLQIGLFPATKKEKR